MAQAEVSIGEGGIPKVQVWCAPVDCGVAVNPDVIRAQIEAASARPEHGAVRAISR
ncbi:hypothetical protein M8494_11760 [Serratia ureilytica]